MNIPIIVKTALNWQKATALAEKAGIVPHPQSNWKWALRQVRAKNPKGVYRAADDLLLKGKDLAKAKEKMGLLPNNIRQKIKALARKQRQGVEVAHTNTGKLVGGQVGGVPIEPGLMYDAHTHPIFAKYRIKAKVKSPGPEKWQGAEWGRLSDDVMAASPSGVNWQARPNPRAEKHYRRLRDKTTKPVQDEINKLWEKYNNNTKVDELGLKPPFPHERFVKLLDKRNNLWDEYIRSRPKKAVLGYSSSKLEDLPEIADFGLMKKQMGSVPYHNIIAGKTTGVHKVRPGLPAYLRSVYFKGGLN